MAKTLRAKDFTHAHLTDADNLPAYLMWRITFTSAVKAVEGYFTVFDTPPALLPEHAVQDVDDEELPSPAHHEQVVRLLLTVITHPEAREVVQLAAAGPHEHKAYHVFRKLDARYKPDDRTYPSVLKSVLNTPQTTSEGLEQYILRLERVNTELYLVGSPCPDSDLVGALEVGLRCPDYEYEKKQLLGHENRFASFEEACRHIRRTSRGTNMTQIASSFFGTTGNNAIAVPAGASGTPDTDVKAMVAEAVTDALSKLNIAPHDRPRNGPNRRKQVCWDYQAGRCHRGNSCRFQHTMDKSSIQCHRCNKYGHYARECPDQAAGGQQQSGQNTESAHVATYDTWCMMAQTVEDSFYDPFPLSSTALLQPSLAYLDDACDDNLSNSDDIGEHESLMLGQSSGDLDSESLNSDLAYDSDSSLPGLMTTDQDSDDDLSDGDALPREPSQSAFVARSEHPGPNLIPCLTSIKPNVAQLVDRMKPIHYLGLCSGATFAIIDALAAAGQPFLQITLVECDKETQQAAEWELHRLHQKHPLQIPRSAITAAHRHLPQDVSHISSTHLGTVPSVDLIVATPDCQPYSAAGKRLGFDDPRSASLIKSAEVVQLLAHQQPDGVNWVFENVPGAADFPEILQAFGEPILVRAHHLGSVAKRDTLLWSNIKTVDFLRRHYASQVRPPTTVGEFLVDQGFAPQWEAPPRLRRGNFPKMLARKGSNAYRMHGDRPGRGMLLHNGRWMEPCTEMRPPATGFERQAVDLPGMDTNLRHRIFGSCLDNNVGKWFAAAILCDDPVDTALPGLHQSQDQHLVFDTGASRHMNSNREEFRSYQPAHIWIQGLCAYALGIGEVIHTFQVRRGESLRPQAIVLKDVLHVPALRQKSGGSVQRLFSWTAAQRQHASLHLQMGSHGNSILLPDGSALDIRSTGRLFTIPLHTPPVSDSPTLALLSTAERQSKVLWHLRLGHLHERGMNRLIAAKVPGLTYHQCDALPFCTACATVKSTVAPRPRHCHPRPDTPYAKVGMDFWEMRTPSLQGNTYVLGATCYATSHTQVLFVRSRASATACLRALLTYVETSGHRVHTLRLDNDTAFRSSDFIALCDSHRVKREYADPYSQFQNGLQERTWRTLSQASFSMLRHAGLPLQYWQFAMTVAVYIYNRTERASGHIPYKTLTGSPPDLSTLRVFGCPCFVHVDPARRRKGDPAAREGIFVGYSPDSTGWQVYFPSTGTTVVSRSVRFNELWRSLPSAFAPDDSPLAPAEEGVPGSDSEEDADSDTPADPNTLEPADSQPDSQPTSDSSQSADSQPDSQSVGDSRRQLPVS